ncbi:MAG: GxxExxY protein [Acidobacteriaceae bacterium]
MTSDPKKLNAISGTVIDSAVKVHTALGPGLLENAYRACLAHELATRGLAVKQEVPLPITYAGRRLEIGYRLDLLAEDLIVVEIKAVETIAPVHRAQLLSYRKLSKRPLGLLLNFNVVLLRDGIVRMRNG